MSLKRQRKFYRPSPLLVLNTVAQHGELTTETTVTEGIFSKHSIGFLQNGHSARPQRVYWLLHEICGQIFPEKGKFLLPAHRLQHASHHGVLLDKLLHFFLARARTPGHAFHP